MEMYLDHIQVISSQRVDNQREANCGISNFVVNVFLYLIKG